MEAVEDVVLAPELALAVSVLVVSVVAALDVLLLVLAGEALLLVSVLLVFEPLLTADVSLVPVVPEDAEVDGLDAPDVVALALAALLASACCRLLSKPCAVYKGVAGVLVPMVEISDAVLASATASFTKRLVRALDGVVDAVAWLLAGVVVDMADIVEIAFYQLQRIVLLFVLQVNCWKVNLSTQRCFVAKPGDIRGPGSGTARLHGASSATTGRWRHRQSVPAAF